MIPKDKGKDNGDNALICFACKLATGSGKTVVMGMVIAWQVLMANPQDWHFSDAVLLVCPNVTIKERLQVFLLWKPGNYSEKFDLVPRGMLERLQRGEVFNHKLASVPTSGRQRSRSAIQQGVERDTASCRRILKDLGDR